MTYNYTTAALVQAELQSSTAFSSSTLPTLTQVNDWIAEESAYINHLSNTIWGSTVYTETLDYMGGDVLILENAPLISVSQVRYNKNRLGMAADWEVQTADTDYSVYADRGAILVLPDWSPIPGAKRIEVTYSAGYATLPGYVQMLATKLVARRVLDTVLAKNINERNDGGSISVGSISIVEPTSYGVGTYKQLKSDIDTLKDQLLKQSKAFRPFHIW